MSIQEHDWAILMTPKGQLVGFGLTQAEALMQALKVRQRENAAWEDADNEEARAQLTTDDEWVATLIEGMGRWMSVFPRSNVELDPRLIKILPVLMIRGVEKEICQVCGRNDVEVYEQQCSWVGANLCSKCREDLPDGEDPMNPNPSHENYTRCDSAYSSPNQTQAETPGYHLRRIHRGVLGELSKIREELEEAEDAAEQGVVLMELIELSDLYGALKARVEKLGHTMNDISHMSTVTERAFLSRRR